jgi:hypothetical protein
MIDKKISLGTLLTIGTVLASVVYTHGASTEKVENVKVEQVKHAKRIDNNSSAIVHLKVGQAKIEAQLDERFNRLEEILLDLE